MNKVELNVVPVFYRPYVLLPVFFLMTAASCVLAERNFSGMFSVSVFRSPLGLLLFAGLPLIVLAFSFFLLYRLYGDSLSQLKGTRAGRNLFVLFACIGAVGVIPCAAVSGAFFTAFSRSDVSSDNVEAFASAIDMSNMYYTERIDAADRVLHKYMNVRSVQTYRDRAAEFWKLVLEEDPRGVCFQVFTAADGNYERQAPYFEIGDSHFFVGSSPQTGFYNGMLPPMDAADADIFRYVTTSYSGDELFICVYTSSFFPGYDAAVELLNEGYEESQLQAGVRSGFVKTGLTQYILCAAPSLLIVLIVLYVAVVRVLFPLSLVTSAAMAAAAGRDDTVLLPVPSGPRGVFAEEGKRAVRRMASSAADRGRDSPAADILLAVAVHEWQALHPAAAVSVCPSGCDISIPVGQEAFSVFVFSILDALGSRIPENGRIYAGLRQIETGLVPHACLYVSVHAPVKPSASFARDVQRAEKGSETAGASFFRNKDDAGCFFIVDFPEVIMYS